MNRNQNFILVTCLLIYAAIIHLPYLDQYPSNLHAWAQADRYALALGFVDNDLNFFRPQTYVMNHQFPGYWVVPGKSRISAVEFPIHDYIPAIAMKITGIRDVVVFRTYVLIYALIGLFFLFKLSLLITENIPKSALVLILAATSPIYVYYQSGLLPSVPCLSNAIIASYFYIKYLKTGRSPSCNLAFLFFCLATLSRTSFGVMFLAALTNEIFRFRNDFRELLRKLKFPTVMIAIVVVYFWYNEWLRETYGSMFLSEPKPPLNLDAASEALKLTFLTWKFQYFSKWHYWIISVLIAIPLLRSLGGKKTFRHKNGKIWIYLLIWLGGCSVFSFLMMIQFISHDYYFLDTFYLPVILMLSLFISSIPVPKFRHSSIFSFTAIAFITLPVFINAAQFQKDRRYAMCSDRIYQTANNFSGSEQFLDDSGISKDATILVLNTYAPNIPFTRMKRKGFGIMQNDSAILKKALSWNYDYILVQNEYFVSETYPSYPRIIRHLNKLANNGKLSICTRSESPVSSTLSEFLETGNWRVQENFKLDCENEAGGYWGNIRYSSDQVYDGLQSGEVLPETDYALELKLDSSTVQKFPGRIWFRGVFKKLNRNPFELILVVNSPTEEDYCFGHSLNDMIPSNWEWTDLDLYFPLPEFKNSDFALTIYIWNNGRNTIYFDNISVVLYE